MTFVQSFRDALIDLLSADEVELVKYLLKDRTDAHIKALSGVLARQIKIGYQLGAKDADTALGLGKHSPKLSATEQRELSRVLKDMETRLQRSVGDRTARDMVRIIDKGYRAGKMNKTISKEVIDEVLHRVKRVEFDNRGRVIKFPKVTPDGKVSWGTKTIRHKTSLPTKTYVTTMVTTATKRAHTHAKALRFKERGYKGFVYHAVGDEATRPHHLALHGRVFIFGTPEADIALACLDEYNCRCTIDPFFDTPEMDVNPKEYEAERAAAATRLLDKTPEGSWQHEYLKGMLPPDYKPQPGTFAPVPVERIAEARLEWTASANTIPNRGWMVAKYDEVYTSDDREAVRFYTASGYEDLNAYLRGKKSLEEIPEYDRDRVVGAIPCLDKVIGMNSLGRDTMVYRGVSPRVAKRIIEEGICEDKGYISTTISPHVALNPMFSGHGDDGFKTVMMFKVAGNDKALWTGSFENEVLLSRGRTYKHIKTFEYDSISTTNEEGFTKFFEKVRVMVMEEVK